VEPDALDPTDAEHRQRVVVCFNRPKPGDAVHLVSGRALDCAEFHTYSKDLPRFAALRGLTIIEPYVAQGQLPV
jgi:predicted nucleic acid-binding protein